MSPSQTQWEVSPALLPSYETSYTTDDEMGKNGWGEGYTFPCLFKNGTKGWTLVSETGVDSRYCASRLIGHEGGLYTVGYPQEGEYNGNGTTAPGIVLPGETPWRTVTVGTTLAPIVETTVAFDLVAPLTKHLRSISMDAVRGAGLSVATQA